MDKSKIKIRSFSDCNELELIIGENITNSFPWHNHRRHCIGLVTVGERIIYFKDRDFHANPGDVFFLRSNEKHACVCRSSSYQVLCFNNNLIKSRDGSIIKDPELKKKMKNLFQLIHGKNILEFITGFREILIQLSGEKNEEIIDAEKPMRYVSDFILKNYRRNISLEELSGMAGLSPYHFIRVFSQIYGISPYAYLIQAKIREAKNKLIAGNTIIDTALDLGFFDQSHFTNTFKKFMGTSPRAVCGCEQIVTSAAGLYGIKGVKCSLLFFVYSNKEK